ncbi:MAG TPA: replication initiation protein [Gammaproteobacteria bacterium]|jgi:plasmid replication initiation protein|nr:replication initiation protein [Gammaproteobacteria bacterium]
MARTSRKTVEKLPEKMELKKHVAVIHSSNKLSLLQRKIANALLFNAYPNLQYKDEHVIHIRTLCELIGYDSNDHKTIKKSLVDLLSTVLQWNLVDGDKLDKEGVWNASSIIADAGIDGAICTYSYSNKMRNLLYRPNLYGRLDMHVLAQFKSGYGLALYENCNRFQDIGQTPWFELETFRQLMGVEVGKYKQFKDFKTRVLDKAIQEVNQFSTLEITPQLKRQNRQVRSIQFLIRKGKALMAPSVGDEAPNLMQRLKTDYGLTDRQTANVISQYEEKYILEKIHLIEASPSFVNGKIKNVARYLLKALSDDFKPAKRPEPKRAEKKLVEVKAKTNKSAALKPEEHSDFSRFQNKWLVQTFEASSAANQKLILKDFEKMLSGVYRNLFLREGLSNILIKDKLCEYLRLKDHSMTQDMPSVQAWRKTLTSTRKRTGS